MRTRIIFLIISFALVLSTFGQSPISAPLSSPRENDVCHKAKIIYTTSGERGENVIWDFSELTISNENYKVSYGGKIDSVLYKNEGNTNYKYRLSGDSLFLLGYENANSRIDYAYPALVLRYPFTYKDSLCSFFYGKGSYSHSLDLLSYGYVQTSSDAYGMLILPENDTLQNVLRIHQKKYIGQKILKRHFQIPDTDSIHNLADTVMAHLHNDTVSWCVDNYQWYKSGYRYPIFETMENTLYKVGRPYKHFNTAFFYSPREQTYQLDDNDNLRERERNKVSLSDKTFSYPERGHGKSHKSSEMNWTFRFEPDHKLSLTSEIEEEANLEILLTTVSGIVVFYQPVHSVSGGIYTIMIDLSGYVEKEYILCVMTNGKQRAMKLVNEQK